jgi:FtsP/CotA-like multicopper oxidase with cupredoxin domain
MLEMVLADRMFDTNGQLLFPDGTPPDNPNGLNGAPPNPTVHPYWIPEFFGDVNVVNGKAWPKIYVIGTDGGLLDKPVQTSELLIGPSARYIRHCHILGHEDNEMMRPYIPVPLSEAQ